MGSARADRPGWQGRSDPPWRVAGNGDGASGQAAFRILGPVAASAGACGQCVNSFTLQPIGLLDELDWGGKAMRFDLLPSECRGAGIKIALVDTGVATSHK